MFKVKNLFWFIPLLVLVTLPLWHPFVADFLRPTVTMSRPRVAAGPDQSLTLTDLTFSQFNRGRQEWRIKAGTLYSENGENDMRLENVVADFFGKAAEGEAAPATNIRSARAHYEKERQLLTLQEDVVVTTTGDYEMHTEVLYYREDLHRLHAASGVTITGQGLLLTGLEMTYDPERQHLQVAGRVRAEIY